MNNNLDTNKLNISEQRDKLKSLESRIDNISLKLEDKVVKYLDTTNSRYYPTMIAELVSALSSLYKLQMDAQEKLIKSNEKEIDIDIKRLKDTNEEEVTFGDLLKHTLLRESESK